MDEHKAKVIESWRRVRRKKDRKAFENGSRTRRLKGKVQAGAFALAVVRRLSARNLSFEGKPVVC